MDEIKITKKKLSPIAITRETRDRKRQVELSLHLAL